MRRGRELILGTVALTLVASPARCLAAIDVGSNSVKLLIARADAEGHLTLLAREKVMVRLGRETLRTGRLPERALAAGTDCIARFAALARASGAERILCAATCAVREAENGAELARRVKAAADVTVEVISGEEEARLITRAVESDVARSAHPLLVVDIGGGSTEVIVASAGKVRLSESLQLGAVRLTEAFLSTDPPSAAALRALRKEVDARLGRLGKSVRRAGYRTAVGTSGTILSLAALAASSKRRPVPESGQRVLTARGLDRVVKLLAGRTLRERQRLPGIEPRRADILVAGALLLQRLFEVFRVERMLVSELSLREGMLLDALDRGLGGVLAEPASFAARDVRRQSVQRLLDRTVPDQAHAQAVCRLALSLFDRTAALHQLAARERDWLEHAALLHEAGISIGYARHHRHTAYLITHGDLKGFASEELDVIAQTARYHRKAAPSASHEPFASLTAWQRSIVEKLSALLRVADALDRSHRQVVTGVRVEVKRRRVIATLSVAGPAELELWAAAKKTALFTRVFGRRLELRLSGSGEHSGELFEEEPASA